MDKKPLDISKTSTYSARESPPKSTEKSQESEKFTYERTVSLEGKKEFSKATGKTKETYSTTEKKLLSSEKLRKSEKQLEKSPTYESVSSHKERDEFSKPVGKNEKNIEQQRNTFVGPNSSERKETPNRDKLPSGKIASHYKKVWITREKSSLAGKEILKSSETSSYHKNLLEETPVSEDSAQNNVMNKRNFGKEPALNLESKTCQSFKLSYVAENKDYLKNDNSEEQTVASGICSCSKTSTSTKAFCSLHSTSNRKTINEDKKATLVCEYCDKVFRFISILNSHRRKHTGEKPFECQHCDKKFSAKQSLREHISRKHTANKPFKCNECGKEFATSAILQKHMVIHNTCSFSCTKCGKGYASRSGLAKHLKHHKDGKAFACQEC